MGKLDEKVEEGKYVWWVKRWIIIRGRRVLFKWVVRGIERRVVLKVWS